MDAILDKLLQPIIAVPLAFFLVYVAWPNVATRHALPKELAWIARRDGELLGNQRASLRAVFSAVKFTKLGHEKVKSTSPCFV